MKKQYLHLCVYTCDNCGGPVVAGSLAARENEISKETDIRQIGAICVSCAHRQTKATAPDRSRQLPPLDWDQAISVEAHPKATFEVALAHAEAN